MLGQLCGLLVNLRFLEAEERMAATGELKAAYLSADLVRARLPATNRLELSWRALDELLVLHSRARAAE